jgi:5,10-methylenetetrahydromethanopterin reductase
VAIGSGFTGRYTLGLKPMRWADVEEYVRVLRALLAGEVATWDGASVRMLHPPGFGAPRPIDVPILIGAEGPKGTAVARAVGDGVFAAAVPNASAAGGRHALLQFGTVLLDGEPPDSPRAQEAAGHAVAVAYHGMYERGGAEVVQGMPGGPEWLAAVEAVPADERHLHVHEGHLVALTDRDRAALAAGGASMIGAFTLTGTPDEVRTRVDGLEAMGVTEVAIQPGGRDIAGELERFATALELTRQAG